MTQSASQIRNACRERLEHELAAMRDFRTAGGKVAGYTCHAFPSSAIAGLGLRAVRVLCGTSSEAESDGERVVRADVCPFVKSFLGNVATGRGLHGLADIWIGLHTCDQMRRGMHVLSDNLRKEVHSIQLPATRTEASAGYYAAQVRRCVSDIERKEGLRFDAETALIWKYESDAAAAVLRKAALSFCVSPTDLHAMFHLFFISRPHGLAPFFEHLIASSEGFQPQWRIVLAGGPLTSEDTALFEHLEERGAAVLPLNCTGMNAVERGRLEEATPDLITSLALEAFDLPTCARIRPNTAIYDRIRETLRETGASGLIVKSLIFCDQWHAERERMRVAFDLPVLVFDSDYAEGGGERQKSRTEAFLETLE